LPLLHYRLSIPQPRLGRNREMVKSTFEYPIGTIILALHNPQVVMLDNNVAIVTGYENVIVNPPAIKEQSVSQVRQTLVVQKIDGKWLIVHHHASKFQIE
jgi:hypothetical protein